jgi:hypothetical protein
MLKMLMGTRLFPWRRKFLTRFCRVVLPGSAQGYPSPEELGTVDAVELYLAGLHPLLRVGLLGLLDLLNFQAIFFGYFRPVNWMGDDTLRRYLSRLETHPFYIVRNAFVAAKALVMLVYYGDPKVERKTGYADDCLEVHV